MIVRISGSGQFEVDEGAVGHLHELDDALTSALHEQDEQKFHELMHQIVQFVRTSGRAVEADRVVPSEVIIPPEDVDLKEAQRFFHDEGLMEPVSA